MPSCAGPAKPYLSFLPAGVPTLPTPNGTFAPYPPLCRQPPAPARRVFCRRNPTAAWHLVVTHFAGLTDAGVSSALAATCGIGLAGILGGTATADARAAFEASRRRQRRLARGAKPGSEGERMWDDVETPLTSPTGLAAIGGPAQRRIAGRDVLGGVTVEGADEEAFWGLPEVDPVLRKFDERLGATPPPSADEFYEELDLD